LSDKQRPEPFHNISGGGTVHLVEVYSHNAVREIIQNARDSVTSQRGRFTLPSEFMDRLMVDCCKWVLDRGAPEAERCACGSITDFLNEQDDLKNEDNERKVKQSLKGTGNREPGTGYRVTTDGDRR
jgi:hypothetical protein